MLESHQMSRAQTSVLVGNDRAAGYLLRHATAGRPGHAYLITGPHHVGKTTLAHWFASSLLCESATDSPCGRCRSCRRVVTGNHPDMCSVRPERVRDSSKSSIGIGQVRALKRRLALTPVEGAWRLAILHRFEKATDSAANALLKLLEEPAPHVVLILLADHPDHLLPTIVSRCQQVAMRPAPFETVALALQERWHAEPDQARLLARVSGGLVGWAVGALQDAAALERRQQRLDDLERLLSASTAERFKYAEVLARDTAHFLAHHAKNDDSNPTTETLAYWSGWARDVLHTACGTHISPSNPDRLAAVQACAGRMGAQGSAVLLTAIDATQSHLAVNANVRLALDCLMLRLPK
jgi:DNA polymerase-3 subunit delta'